MHAVPQLGLTALASRVRLIEWLGVTAQAGRLPSGLLAKVLGDFIQAFKDGTEDDKSVIA